MTVIHAEQVSSNPTEYVVTFVHKGLTQIVLQEIVKTVMEVVHSVQVLLYLNALPALMGYSYRIRHAKAHVLKIYSLIAGMYVLDQGHQL